MWWDGEPDPPGLPGIWSRKPMVAVGGRPVSAELAVVSELALMGWQGVWVSAFGNFLRREWFPAPAFRTIAATGAPQWAAQIFDALKDANGGRLAGILRCVRLAGAARGSILRGEGRPRPDPGEPAPFSGQCSPASPAQRVHDHRDASAHRKDAGYQTVGTAGRADNGWDRSPRGSRRGRVADLSQRRGALCRVPAQGRGFDYSGWASLSEPRAWERLGNGELLPATGGQRPSLVAKSRCRDCVSHGPW